MTASAANGFQQIVFDPSATRCSSRPYSFHPMYSTSSEHTRVPWAAHSYNVAFSDEIGHWEYCNHANVKGVCVNPGVTENKKDADDTQCFNADASLRIAIGGGYATAQDMYGDRIQSAA